MKNIHVLPTDKPSRFSLKSSGEYCLTNQLYTNSPNFTNRHIYITSDEEIKEGDWCIDLDTYTLFKLGNWKTENGKKIILTTDPDLIGVQSIDNEFLEWFVKNPSCEEVEVQDMSMQYHDEGYYEYKIIIPQEEPKQETLEEAAERYVENYKWEEEQDPWFDFMEGAKWQSERMYSEEEVKEILIKTDRFLRADLNLWFEQFKKK